MRSAQSCLSDTLLANAHTAEGGASAKLAALGQNTTIHNRMLYLAHQKIDVVQHPNVYWMVICATLQLLQSHMHEPQQQQQQNYVHVQYTYSPVVSWQC